MAIYKASVLAALLAAVSALQVNSPGRDAQVDLSKETTISWSSVSSDPTSFSIVLVNQAVNPPVSINIADNVQTSAGSFNVPAQDGVTTGGNYQFNLISKTAQNEGILAQSQQFSVTGSGSADSSSSAGSSATSGASSASGTARSSAASGSSAASSTAAATSTSASGSSSGSRTGSSTASSNTGSSTASANGAASLHLASGVAGLGFVGAIIALFA